MQFAIPDTSIHYFGKGKLAKINPVKNEVNSIHIILVDDDPVLVDTMKELLEMLGYIVATATGGNEAIALMKSFTPDVVITDYAMPGMNGIEFALHARKVLGDTPVILCSGSIHLIDGQQMTGAGLAGVVSKPCSVREIDSTIKKVIAEKKKI